MRKGGVKWLTSQLVEPNEREIDSNIIKMT